MRNGIIRNKLRSRKGASLALALMLLLVTSMVTAVVLASAVTTAKREKSRKDTQQALLTLQSAVTMVRDQFTDSRATIIEVKETEDSISGTTDVSFTAGSLRTPAGELTNPLSAASLLALKEAYDLNCSGGRNPTPIPVGTFTVSAQVGEEELEPVSVAVTMLGNKHDQEESYMDFQIELVCTVGDRDERLDIKLDTDVSRSVSRSKGSVVTVTEITWRPEGEA